MDVTTDQKIERQALPRTCNDYRQEMMLLAMRRKLENDGLDEEQRRRLRQEIAHLESQMGMD